MRLLMSLLLIITLCTTTQAQIEKINMSLVDTTTIIDTSLNEYRNLKPSKIAAEVENYRIKHNLSRAEMAKKLGIAEKILLNIETGAVVPTREMLNIINLIIKIE